ncbi:hypothetical protein HPB48_012713 [Haemaphysalis longicornis]|uniref:Uncharacterized protein n=1 Tax=Haemaphysalis longicornis TaxID=44386 RepID=A0A9J6FZ47_HAELO|nr:hypothetical protein HPB48_012713 [Haemaphysalis longicornis]
MEVQPSPLALLAATCSKIGSPTDSPADDSGGGDGANGDASPAKSSGSAATTATATVLPAEAGELVAQYVQGPTMGVLNADGTVTPMSSPTVKAQAQQQAVFSPGTQLEAQASGAGERGRAALHRRGRDWRPVASCGIGALSRCGQYGGVIRTAPCVMGTRAQQLSSGCCLAQAEQRRPPAQVAPWRAPIECHAGSTTEQRPRGHHTCRLAAPAACPPGWYPPRGAAISLNGDAQWANRIQRHSTKSRTSRLRTRRPSSSQPPSQAASRPSSWLVEGHALLSNQDFLRPQGLTTQNVAIRQGNMVQTLQIPMQTAAPTLQQTIPVQVPISTGNGQTVFQTIHVPVQTLEVVATPQGNMLASGQQLAAAQVVQQLAHMQPQVAQVRATGRQRGPDCSSSESTRPVCLHLGMLAPLSLVPHLQGVVGAVSRCRLPVRLQPV